MIYTNTLASMLNLHYMAMHKQAILNISALGAPGDTMIDSEVRDRTRFGQLLHKEGLWSLYKFDEDRSLLYHLCRGYTGMTQTNSPADPRGSRCVACNSMAPDEIRGLWTLHNFEWVQYHSKNREWDLV